MEHDEIPIGLLMALAQNPNAMQKFALLSESKKQEIINDTHAIHSRKEMHHYVEKILSEY